MQFYRRAKRFAPPFLLLLIALCGTVRAQSLDINAPSAVSASELSGRVLARDIGDARFTDHYYAFAANPGDLVITIESKNLNGDVDVFTAGALRPLMKFSIYAESSEPLTKAVFLRKREDLILRVEVRSPNDDEGTYQIKFGGTFEPLAAPVLTEEAATTEATQTGAVTAGDKKVRRVTSSGARIYEPEPPPPPAEVAAVPTPEPTPEPTAEPTLTETPAETPANVAEKPVETPKVTTTPRNSRNRRPAGRRATRPRPPAETAATTEATSPDAETVAKPQEEIGPRLVIETRDGTLINRSMMTVRRVMVENGQVIVVGRDGKVQRVQLVDVVRMTIAP